MTGQAAPNLHTNILNRIANELALTYQGVFSAETINRYIFESYVSLARTAKSIRTCQFWQKVLLKTGCTHLR